MIQITAPLRYRWKAAQSVEQKNIFVLKCKTDCATAVATLPLIYEQWIQALATAYLFQQACNVWPSRPMENNNLTRACKQMLSTTRWWNGTRSVCKRAENINYKVRSLRWGMLEEAQAAHVCCAPDSLFWEIQSYWLMGVYE